MASAKSKVSLCALLALIVLVSGLSANSKLESAGNAQFEVVGFQARSVSYVEELSQHVVDVAERYLDPNALRFPQRVLISLRPSDFVEFEGDYFVRVGERGFVNLDLRWEEPLSLRTTCQALAEALLVRYSIFNYGEDGPGFLPIWPATAIGTKAYLSLRPAHSQLVADWLDLLATPSVESLLQRKWGDPVADANGYALLFSIESSGIDRGDVRKLVAQSIAGVDIAAALKVLTEPSDPLARGVELEDWWRVSLERLLAPDEAVMETMEASRIWLEALSDLSRAGKEDLNLARIWNERENEGLRDLIEARYEILRLRILRVNPTYFNAARSLGALFETYLSDDAKRHRYIHRLTAFLGDFEDAKRLEEVVVKALAQVE